LINTFIGFFKDTSLVLIIGIFDFLNSANQALVDTRLGGLPGRKSTCSPPSSISASVSRCRATAKYLEVELNRGRALERGGEPQWLQA